MRPENPLVFALHGTSRGFGYVVFEGPFTPYDWGTVVARGEKNTSCLAKLEVLLDRHSPEILILEEARSVANRSERIKRLYAAVASMCMARNIDVAVYSLAQVKSCFARVGAKTRHEIAQAVGRQISAIAHLMPKLRRAWHSEDRRMAMFCAAALVLVHFQLSAATLFDELSV